MSKAKIAVLLSVLLIVALTASAFAELVVTYQTQDDAYSEFTVGDSEARIQQATANSLISNGDFTTWGTALGPSDPWTFWRDTKAGWEAGRLSEFSVALPSNPEGVSNAMGWFIKHNGAKDGGYYAGAYQPLARITTAGRYYVTVSATAFSGGKTGPYNSVAWYAISNESDPALVTEWRELFPDQYVCSNGDEVCNYVGRDEMVDIVPGQYFHLKVGHKFPEQYGWTQFVIDDISIVAWDGGPNNAPNGFFNWCNASPEDVKVHGGQACNSFTEVHWDSEQTR